MDLEMQQLDGGSDRINLAGRLDSAGVQEIDHRLSALGAARRAFILVDLSQVPFLASIGIRILLTNARMLRQRGGSMALLSPQPAVDEVLKATAIASIIPVFRDLDAASAALKALAASA